MSFRAEADVGWLGTALLRRLRLTVIRTQGRQNGGLLSLPRPLLERGVQAIDVHSLSALCQTP